MSMTDLEFTIFCVFICFAAVIISELIDYISDYIEHRKPSKVDIMYNDIKAGDIITLYTEQYNKFSSKILSLKVLEKSNGYINYEVISSTPWQKYEYILSITGGTGAIKAMTKKDFYKYIYKRSWKELD